MTEGDYFLQDGISFVDLFALTFAYDFFLRPSIKESREAILDTNAPTLKAHAINLLDKAPHVKAYFDTRFDSHA
jgi:hypothetical protein